jgi:CDP-diacylglycerol---glycerol-3-phosphate 3-phosphatidyltransferase
MENLEIQTKEKLHFHDRFLAKTILRLIPHSVKPNQITIFRFIATPFVVYLLYCGYYTLGFWAFIITAFSDMLDGSLARTRNQVTDWGKIYDPLADKILIASMIFVIVLKTINFWTSIIIITLEVIIIIAAWIRKMEGRVVQANWWGKIKMILQVLGVSVLLLAIIFEWAPLLLFASGTLYLAIAFAVISLLTHGV